MTTEAAMTSFGEGLDDRGSVTTKTTTTVAMDFGRIAIDEDMVLFLFGELLPKSLFTDLLKTGFHDLAHFTKTLENLFRLSAQGLLHADRAGRAGPDPRLSKNSGIVRRRLTANARNNLLHTIPDDTQDLLKFRLEASRENVVGWDIGTLQLVPSVLFSFVRAVILGTRACEIP